MAATRVIDTDEREEERGEREDDERWIDSESGGRGGWDDDGDDDVIPPRPRGRLLRPLPLALIALIIAAAGFLGGIEAQKGSESGSGAAAGPGGGGLPNFAALKEAGAESGGTESKGSEAGVPGFAGSSAAATGTVTSVEGHTIYVKESDGTTVAVKVGDGATVTRDSNVAAKKIHPGDTVTVEGSKHGSTVKASSVSATESGVEAESSVKSLFEE
jgi:hypothetical protein